MPGRLSVRVTLAGAALLTLILVYLFQQFNYAFFLGAFIMSDPQAIHPDTVFVINKTLRLMINDLACMLMIFAIFQQRNYLVISFYVFIFELFILLPLYLVIKLFLEGDSEISSPLLSQVHRLIVNPMLMIILMIGFFYQRLTQHNAGSK
jgi:exosortase F-associated protein